MIRALVVDDHAIVREGVRLILASQPDIDVVGEARHGLEAVDKARLLSPDVVCMDVSMPGMDGIEATRRIRDECPGTAVVALSVHDSDEYFFQMLQAGASGYVLKGASGIDLVQAVRTVASGGAYLHPPQARRLVEDFVSHSGGRESADAAMPGLTARERQVLMLVGSGLDNRAIAENLVISVSTVQTHVGNILDKLGLSSRTALLYHAVRHGLFADEP